MGLLPIKKSAKNDGVNRAADPKMIFPKMSIIYFPIHYLEFNCGLYKRYKISEIKNPSIVRIAPRNNKNWT